MEKLEAERLSSTNENKDMIYGLEKARLEVLGPHAFKRTDVDYVLNLFLDESIEDVKRFLQWIKTSKSNKERE